MDSAFAREGRGGAERIAGHEGLLAVRGGCDVNA